jgi:hypothetical protein
MRKHRAFFTRRTGRGNGPQESLMFGQRGYIPHELWALFGLLPGMRVTHQQRAAFQQLTMEDYLGGPPAA